MIKQICKIFYHNFVKFIVLDFLFSPCYNFTDNYSKEYHIDMHDFYSSKAFEKHFTYNGNDLGATWSPEMMP